MKIKGLNRVIPGGRHIESIGDNLLLYTLDDGLYCNGELISPTYLYPYLNYDGGHYLRSSEPPAIYRLDPESNSIRLCVSRSRRIRLGTSDECLLLGRYKNREHTYTLELEGKEIWTKTTSLSQVIQVGPYALFYQGRGQLKGSCQLIELATGAVLWELDHPDAYISQVYPYKDKVIIVWFWELGTKGTNRVLCVEVPSGKVLWENDAARKYKKYGNDKLVFFYSSLWEDGYERGDNHQLAELDVRTGAFQMYKFPGYNSSTYVTTVYKDYLFYGTLNYYFYVGAIDLRTHEMLPEVKIDYTPGNLNQISSIGVHDGQLYVEIQTELDHSDIHVLELDEEECSAGKKGISMGRKIRICTDRREWCYREQSTSFYAHLSELLKDPSRVEQLAKEGYVVFDCLNHRIRALDVEFLEVLQDYFLELERKGKLYTPGSPEPDRLFLWQPGVTSKLLAKSSIEVQAVLGPHTIPYEDSRVYMNVIYCDTRFIGPEEKEYLIERYGAPTYTEWREEYGLGEWYIIIPVEDVDKLVAVERFLALDDTDERPVYTGEERVYELDLRAPEESVYKYFLEREIIREYDPENFAPEYLYPPQEEDDTEEQRSKGRYLPSWPRSLWRKVLTLLRGEGRE